MSALTDYCDEIYKYSCEYGKEQIGHEGMTIVRLPLEQDNQQDDQQDDQHRTINRTINKMINKNQ